MQADPGYVFNSLYHVVAEIIQGQPRVWGAEISGQSRMTMWSWGEIYQVAVSPTPGGCQVSVLIKFPLVTQVLDFGMLTRRQDDFLARAQQVLGLQMIEIARR